MLLAFADAGRFGDAQEPVPIEVISDSQFNRLMGEKAAEKGAKPRVDKPADTSKVNPTPSEEDAKRDIPVPPSRPPEPDPAVKPPDETKSVAAVPPPLPVEPPPPVPEPPKRDPAAELAKPEPEPIARPPEPPKVVRPPEPKVDPLEQAKKLLEQKKQQEAKVDLKRAKPKAEDSPQYKFDSSALTKILTHDPSQQAGSTGKELNRTASLGSPTASAARMPGYLSGQFDSFLKEAYKRCFNPVPFDVGDYRPRITVRYNIDGSLAAEPKLLNPPSDPALRAYADSAMRAVRSCNPLHIAAIYQPYFEDWRNKTMQFENEQ
jgi:colicin import membrane protein